MAVPLPNQLSKPREEGTLLEFFPAYSKIAFWCFENIALFSVQDYMEYGGTICIQSSFKAENKLELKYFIQTSFRIGVGFPIIILSQRF